MARQNKRLKLRGIHLRAYLLIVCSKNVSAFETQQKRIPNFLIIIRHICDKHHFQKYPLLSILVDVFRLEKRKLKQCSHSTIYEDQTPSFTCMGMVIKSHKTGSLLHSTPKL